MMQPVIPIIMGLLNMVASKTGSFDFSDTKIGSGVRRGHRDDMFVKSRNFIIGPDEFTEWEALDQRQQRRNIFDDNADDLEVRIRPEDRPQNDRMSERKIPAHDVYIDDETREQLEAASISIDEMDEDDLNHLIKFLTKILSQPTYEPPLVIIDTPMLPQESEEADPKVDDGIETGLNLWKRSRYYREYPWKRQNVRSRLMSYDYDATQFCSPKRGDLLKILVAMHDIRHRTDNQAMRFCERHHTPAMLLSNVRFIGRRK